MSIRHRFSKTTFGTLQCGTCRSTALKLTERVGWRGPYYVTFWKCKKCGQKIRYEQIQKPDTFYKDPDRFKATFDPYAWVKRGLNIIHPKLER